MPNIIFKQSMKTNVVFNKTIARACVLEMEQTFPTLRDQSSLVGHFRGNIKPTWVAIPKWRAKPGRMGRDYFAGLKVTKRNKATVLLTLTLLQTPTLTLTLILTLTLT
jgi:hypothetical protein